MAILNQNFRMKKNTHLDVIFNMENVSDLSSYCIVWGAFTKAEDEVLLKTSNDPSEITIDGSKFIVHLTPDDNKNLDRDILKHEARITNHDGTTTVVSKGTMTVVGTLTSPCE